MTVEKNLRVTTNFHNLWNKKYFSKQIVPVTYTPQKMFILQLLLLKFVVCVTLFSVFQKREDQINTACKKNIFLHINS